MVGFLVSVVGAIHATQTVSSPPRHDDTRSRRNAATSRPTSGPARGRIVPYARGIRINYPDAQVEIDAEVILREGPLELFAYSKAPNPKEHESILLLYSSPERIYEALGLLGLNPGKPMRYFPDTQKVRMPTGDPVEVLVRYDEKGAAREVSACDWMLNLKTEKPMGRTHWLFTGSERLEDGTFMANIDGTIVTVVDFTSSVLGLPERHSDSDPELWLVANTDAIPPERTKVTLILRRIPTEISIRIDASGRILANGELRRQEELPDWLRTHTSGWSDRAKLRLDVAAKAPVGLRAAVLDAAKKAGIQRAR
jgi:hypothetical protein